MEKLKPKRKFGQNFLIAPQVIRDLVEAGNILKTDLVLEIGAGAGAVTQELGERAGQVIAVEIDQELIPRLRRRLKNLDNVRIVRADILKRPLPSVPPRIAGLKIIGSIPYQITSPLIHKLIKEGGWETAVLLVQKEAAEKITARPPKATYLSNFVQTFAEAALLKKVPRRAFRPQPKVDGAIVKLKAKGGGGVRPERWSRFLHRGFAHPRKMLKKSLPLEIISKAKISPKRRPATLTGREWLKLYSITLE